MKFGLIGASRIAASALIPAFAHAQDATAHGVAARDAIRARAYAQEHDLPRAYPDYRALLDDPQIEAVYISLPNSEHREWTLRALEAGKHVLCEKPLALDAREAGELAAAAGAAGRVLLEAFMWRFHPQVERALALRSELGELRNIGASFSFTLPPGGDIRWDPALGGGSIYDVGCYTVSAARTFSGLEPLRAVALAEYSLSGVDHRMNALLEFPGGLRASLDCAFSQPFRQQVWLVGETGTLTLEAPFVPGDAPRLLHNSAEVAVEAADPYTRMVEHFVRAARGDEALRYPPQEAVQQARVLDALLATGRSGQVSEVAGDTKSN